MSLRVVLLTSIIAASAAMTVYDPPNAGVALDAVEKALANIVKSPHLTKAQLDQAKKVAADVEKTVEELETPEGKKLSKEARAAKVTASIKELQDLQGQWQKAAAMAISYQKGDLLKQLKAKEDELKKDQKMLKVINLEKALAEKKLALQKLIDMKNAKANAGTEQDAQKQAAARKEMVANLVDAAKSLKDTKPSQAKAAVGDKLKTVLTYLEGRVHDVNDKLAKLDAAEKKHEAEVNEVVGKKAPVQDGKDPLAKGQGILKMLLKREQRQFKKARAPLQNELKQLHDAETSIKKGDVAGLTKVMTQMQGEMKSLDAKSHKFLY